MEPRSCSLYLLVRYKQLFSLIDNRCSTYEMFSLKIVVWGKFVWSPAVRSLCSLKRDSHKFSQNCSARSACSFGICGAGGDRTLVLTMSLCSFYMFSLLLNFNEQLGTSTPLTHLRRLSFADAARQYVN